MLLEGLVLMTGAEVGKHLLKSATEVSGGAAKEYLKGFFKGKLGDIVDTFKLELKAAMEKAIGEFMKLFVEELQDSGVSDNNIDRYYVKSMSIESFIKDPDTIAILGEAFGVSFKRFDSDIPARIQGIWVERYSRLGLTFPVDFNWQLLLDKYEFKVKDIRRADEKLRKILDSEALGSIDDGIKKLAPILESIYNVAKESYEIKKSIAPIPIEFNLDRYRERLQGSYGRLKLGKLESKGKHDIQLVKIFIEQNVREALPPDPSPDPNSDESTQNRRQYLEKSAEPVLTVLRDENCQRAVLLGEPGSGKSSLLQYLALDWAEGKTKRLPLLIELRECAIERFGEKNFLDFLSGGASANCTFDRHQLHEYLRTKDSLVMFDGLDEIFDRKLRESTIGKIVSFATQDYPKAKIVITSRLVGYERDLLGVEFQHFTLQELDESQIHEFIDKWHQLALGEDPRQEQLKRQLKEAIDRSPAIQNLANNPLLLTLMAMLNQQGDLPTRRVDLYDRASQLLLHNWDFEGKNLKLHPSIETIEADEKQEILGNIAYQMQSEEAGLAGNLLNSKGLKQILTGYFKANDFLEPPEKAKRLIKQLSSRSFILCAYGTDAYGFVHRTFLEYFCARDFVRRHNEEPYPSLEQLRDDVFAQHWQDETWHEVLQLICGLLKPKEAGYLVEFLMDREVDRSDYLEYDEKAATGAFQHLRLATECWAEVKSPQPRSTAQKLKEKLKEEIESQSKISLGSDAAKLLLDSIAEYYHKEPETLIWLQNVALNSQHKDLRRAAVESLVEYYHSTPESLNCLQNVALNDQHEYIRELAVYSIGEYYHSTPQSLNCLQNVALNDQHEDIRRLAVKSIGKYYHKEPETLTCLQNVALNDQHEDIRRLAVKSIGKYYHKEPETLTCLQNVALNSQHEDVRWEAVQSIAQYCHKEPETLTWLQQVALNSQHEAVRAAAVYSIGKYHHSKPENLNCLQQVALNDRNEWVRWEAVYSIAQYYIQIDSAFKLLCQIASQDSYRGRNDGNPRKTALKAVVKNYIDRPEVIELLRDRSTQEPDEELRIWAEEQLKNIG